MEIKNIFKHQNSTFVQLNTNEMYMLCDNKAYYFEEDIEDYISIEDDLLTEDIEQAVMDFCTNNI